MRFSFPIAPALRTQLGEGLSVRTLTEIKAYTRRDGAASSILTWSGACKRCKEPYDQRTGLIASGLTVHCRECTKPLRDKMRLTNSSRHAINTQT